MHRLIIIVMCVVSFFIALPFCKAAESIDHIKQKALQGDVSAQCELGERYLKGENTPINYAEAMKWFRKAAEKGDPVALFGIGWMYHNEKGVPRNYLEAIKWYEKAGDKGSSYAYLYINGSDSF